MKIMHVLEIIIYTFTIIRHLKKYYLDYSTPVISHMKSVVIDM